MYSEGIILSEIRQTKYCMIYLHAKVKKAERLRERGDRGRAYQNVR